MPSIYSGLIKITKTPHYGTSREIREAWVGRELPCLPQFDRLTKEEIEATHCDCDVCHHRTSGYVAIVPIREALEILARKSPWAAEQLRSSLSENPTAEHFAFAEEEIRVIDSSVTHPRMTEVPAEAQGQLMR